MTTRLISLVIALPILMSCGKPDPGFVTPPPTPGDDNPENPTDPTDPTNPTDPNTPVVIPSTDGYIIVGYAYADSGALPDPTLLTHINFSFAKIQDDFETVYIRDKKAKRLDQIVGLKDKNPNLKVLLSVGGWGADYFSQMAASETHRQNFCKNCLKLVNDHHLDGIDIDWEYPTSDAAGIACSPADKDNFTLLMRDLRQTLGNDKLLTMASEAKAKYVDWKNVIQYLDFVNIMSYDMGKPPTHNAALYPSDKSTMSCEESVAKHLAAGIPANKLTLGMAFFGRVDRNILQGDELDYNEIIQLTGFNKNWDDVAKVPYLTDSYGTMVLSYDDEVSIGLKADYVKQKGLKGAMYWDIEADDSNWTLGKAVASRLLPESVPENETVLVTNQYMENFMQGVSYVDFDFNSSMITSFPGGGPGEADIPPSYTIKWTADASAGAVTLKLWDAEWSRTWSLSAGTSSQVVTNLVPNTTYSYMATASSGKLLGNGSFNTRGTIHQVYFKSNVRNGRDIGGWKTSDGKTVRYRLLYRGGRVDKSYMDNNGIQEALAQGILAELDLREKEDVPSKSYFGDNIAFLAPGFGESENYRTMLRDRAEGVKQCFQFIVNCLRDNKPVYFHCAAGRDRTGTIALVLLGVLGVREGDIGKDYELTYFSPDDWSMSSDGTYHHMRTAGSYSRAIQYLCDFSSSKKDLKEGAAKYLISIGISQKDIDDFRFIMLK